MADFRPFSTPSPLLIFPSASPASKLQCTPTRKPPTPIDWTEECYQGMLLEADRVQYQHHPWSTDEKNKYNEYIKNNISPVITMDGTQRRNSTMALYHCEASPSAPTESPVATNLIPCVTNKELKPTNSQSFTPSVPSASASASITSSSNISIMSSSTSSMSSYISSISNSDENESDPGVSVILKPRHQRPRYVSMIHERPINHNIKLTGTSWQSTSAQSIATTLREYQYQERFAKKKSKFSLLVAKMKRAAEQPFRMMD